jgi:hypothetical protein
MSRSDSVNSTVINLSRSLMNASVFEQLRSYRPPHLDCN